MDNFDIENKMEGIVSLDEDTPDYIYVYHELYPTIKHRITLGACILNQKLSVVGFITRIIDADSTIINNQDGISLHSIKSQNTDIKCITKEEELEAFLFAMKYIDQYTNISEWEGLKKPAIEANVKYWLDDSVESKLFGQFRDSIMNNIDIQVTIRKISILVLFANYLGMSGLLDKCCYLIAYAINGKTPAQVQNIMDI